MPTVISPMPPTATKCTPRLCQRGSQYPAPITASPAPVSRNPANRIHSIGSLATSGRHQRTVCTISSSPAAMLSTAAAASAASAAEGGSTACKP